MGSSKPGVAIIGLGKIAETHASPIGGRRHRRPRRSVRHRSGARGLFADQFGMKARFDLHEVIADPAVDVVT
jgi:predicted dehydrogenase